MVHIVMVVLSSYPSDPRVRREAEALEKLGIYVDIICVRLPDEKKVEKIKNIEIHRVIKYASNKENIFRYLFYSFHFMVAAFFKLQYLNLINRYKLIQIHNMPDYLVFIAIIQRILGTPVILDLHDLSVELFEAKWNHRLLKLFIPVIRFAEKISCGFSNDIITTSYGFKNCILKRGIPPEKITLVLNTADNNIFEYNNTRKFVKIEKSAKLLYHGSVAKRFGLSNAIKAVAIVQKTIPETTLTIYGFYEPSHLNELKRLVDQLELKRYVKFNNYVSLEKINEIIDESDIGVVPYFKDSFMNLALSTKSFEYALKGLPIVASRLPPMKSIFDEDCVYYYDPDNHEELAEKIIEFCHNPELRKKCVEKSIEVYQAYSWPIMAERYCNLITKYTGDTISK
ncbi:MAG TPA: glycosyltransferase [bacterium]|nr:glycosyltransferase [bacterium]